MTHTAFQPVTILPLDEHNRTLLNQVHPPEWVNPKPADRYDLVVIGAGTAGLVVAAGAAGLGLGLKVALIERHLMGGDCLNFGCVPSKCVIRSSRAVADIADARQFGVRPPDEVTIDFPAVMARMRRLRAGISHHDSVERFRSIGVDVFLGEGRFEDDRRIVVGGQTLRFKKAVIATGARAVEPDIPGLAEAGFLTNETVFSLTECPPRLAVIGGGPIGCELAQAFHRLGSQVIVLHRGGHLLDREDADAAHIIQQAFLQAGVNLALECELQQTEVTPEGKVLYYQSQGETRQVVVDEILVGAGRTPNLEGLNLDAVGVAYSQSGVQVNEYLQTTNPRIYAAGDICLDWKFTHAADAAARIVIQNTLFAPFGRLGRARVSDLVMPWVTFTDPEVAHVGLSEVEAQRAGLAVNVIKIPLEKVDRALADGETQGFVKIIHPQDSDKILGATIVARHAGEMISEVTTAIVGGIGLNMLSKVIHPYPTQAEGIKKAADAYRRTKLTPGTRRLLGLLNRLA